MNINFLGREKEIKKEIKKEIGKHNQFYIFITKNNEKSNEGFLNIVFSDSKKTVKLNYEIELNNFNYKKIVFEDITVNDLLFDSLFDSKYIELYYKNINNIAINNNNIYYMQAIKITTNKNKSIKYDKIVFDSSEIIQRF